MDVIDAMEKQWAKEPPVGLLVAHFLGFKPKKGDTIAPNGGKKKATGADKLQALRELFPTGVIK